MMKFAGWGHPDKAYDVGERPFLLDFIHAQIGLDREPTRPTIPEGEVVVPPARVNVGFMAAVTKLLPGERIAEGARERLLHAYGKSYRDLLRARAGAVPRPPDVVLFPETTAEIAAIFNAARAFSVQIIPFGGGTNIVGGVEPDSNRAGMAATVSLRRMNRVLEVNPLAHTARLQAGALGPELEGALNAQGFTLGHFPDSFEFSTLGGWLATRSAGMQSDAYGKIEDMVVSLTLVTPSGTLVTQNVPRSATGPDLNQVAVGSEGVLGIIAEAVMRVHPLLRSEYRGVLVPGFENGIGFARALAQSGFGPSTTRIANPQETALGFAMKPQPTGFSQLIQKAFKLYLRRLKRFPIEDSCLMILGFEGASAREFALQRRRVLALAREFGAVDLGTQIGSRWFAAKYEYPYLRDFVMDRGAMVDVNETAATWDKLPGLYRAVNEALQRHLRRGDFPGYVGCHLSHSYREGACLYFTFAAAAERGHELAQYEGVKRLIFDLLLEHGATLTHHHAVGSELLPWMPSYLGGTGLRLLRGIKSAVDPENICNPGKLIPSEVAAPGAA